MKKFTKKKGNRMNTKFIYLTLVFIMAIALSSSATYSYAKYKVETIINKPPNIALPIVDYERGDLIRNKDKVDEHIYSTSDKEIIFTDIKPQDSIEYTFSINNFIEEKGKNQINEVFMEVDLYFRVYLKRLVADEPVNPEDDNISYFIIETDYEVESTPDSTNMKGASITFSKKNGDKYDTLNKLDDFDAFESGPEVGVYVDLETRIHKYKLYFMPGERETQNIFKVNIVLPEQVVDATETIAGRLYIEVGFDAQQKQIY